jgi:hypothetical protein
MKAMNKELTKERTKILRNRIKELRDARSAALEEIKEIQNQLTQKVDCGVEYNEDFYNLSKEKNYA